MAAVTEAAEGSAKMLNRERKAFADRVTTNLYALQGKNTNESMALLMGDKSRSTWNERKRNPMNMKLGEFFRLSEQTGVPVEEIIFGRVERR